MKRTMISIGTAVAVVIMAAMLVFVCQPVQAKDAKVEIQVSSETLSISVLAPPGTVYDWVGGVPALTENSVYDWVGGKVFVRLEVATLSIGNSPSSWSVNGGTPVEVGQSSSTAINYFTVTNTGGVAADVTIQGVDLTGGDDTWTLSDTATPGENIYGLYAGLDDDDDLFDIIVKKSSPYNTLVSDLPVSGTQDWGLKIYLPTSVPGYDGQGMSGIITLVASAA